MCVSDLLPSVLASVHTCNHRACKDMYSAFGNPPTSTGARTHAHTLVGTSWLENPSAARKRTSYFQGRCTRTHTQPHPHTHTHAEPSATQGCTREGQRRLHVFSRWRGLGPRRYPRILAMIKDTYTVSPAGADPRPRISYTPWGSWVLSASADANFRRSPRMSTDAHVHRSTKPTLVSALRSTDTSVYA